MQNTLNGLYKLEFVCVLGQFDQVFDATKRDLLSFTNYIVGVNLKMITHKVEVIPFFPNKAK